MTVLIVSWVQLPRLMNGRQWSVCAVGKENIEKELNGLKEKIDKKDMDGIKAAMESLQKASHKLAEEVYKATAAQQAAGPQPGAEEAQATDEPGQASADDKKDDDVIDADFKTE